MCGIVALVSSEPVNQRLYDALLLLQHRGQDAAGIGTYDGRFHRFDPQEAPHFNAGRNADFALPLRA